MSRCRQGFRGGDWRVSDFTLRLYCHYGFVAQPCFNKGIGFRLFRVLSPFQEFVEAVWPPNLKC